MLREWLNHYRVANIKGLTIDTDGLDSVKTSDGQDEAVEDVQEDAQGDEETRNKRKWCEDGSCKIEELKVQMINLLIPNKFFHDLGLIDMSKYEVGLLLNYFYLERNFRSRMDTANISPDL